MSKALNKRISKAYDKIYSKGDNGLEYMDGHWSIDQELMQFFYDDAVETLSLADKTRMAEMLEEIANDMACDLV
jgi:uncharacterized protein YutD